MTRRFKVLLAYDGTDFAGWQIQDRERTVQAVVEQALAEIHSAPVPTIAAGRTDAGVHAAGQVIHFDSEKANLPVHKVCDALNYYLPPDVRALACQEVSGSFHARRSARLRVYKYYLYFSDAPLPHFRKYCLWRRRQPDLARLNMLAAVLLGEHDFTTFSTAGDKNKSKKRTIVTSCFYPSGPFWVYEIAGNAFLWKMVRSLVGTLLDLESKKADAGLLQAYLAAKDRSLAGPTVAARGLFLDAVRYQQEEVDAIQIKVKK
jgi:tRNA pseudouridine38-40 synthase